MQLRTKSSDSEAYTHTLLELNASAIKNAMQRWLLELLNNYRDHKRSQSNNKNDDENEASEAI